jgi:hypothetical protein
MRRAMRDALCDARREAIHDATRDAACKGAGRAMIASALRDSQVARAAPAIATCAAALLLVAVVAYWLWRWLAPAPVHVIVAPPRDPVATIVASGWLAAPPPAAGTAAAPAALAGDARLIGVIADTGGGGYALFRLPAGPKLVREGGAIASGATLVHVAPFTIRIRDASGERDIALRADNATANPLRPAQVSRAAAPPHAALAACVTPAGFSGPVVRLNAELLQGLAGQPDALRAIVVPQPGGMAVREGSGFAQMLGLAPGDRVRLANGIPLSSADDVMAAVVTPLVANQSVRLAGTRNGHPQEMLLLNAGACPG